MCVKDKYAIICHMLVKKIAMITGCSSGIGLESALELARADHRVFAGLRDESKSDQLRDASKKEDLDVQTFQIDVANSASVKNATSKILDETSRLDVLVNNAGYGLFGSIENITIKDMKEQFETNFFGAVEIIQQITPVMRTQKSGKIINISSVAGKIGFPCSLAYVSSKFALEGLSECLRFELGVYGIHTILIEPGVIKTKFMDNIKMSKYEKDSPYAEITDKVITGIKMMAELGTPASDVAKAVVKAATEDNPLPRYIVGNDASMFLEAKKSMTDIEFEEYVKKELY